MVVALILSVSLFAVILRRKSVVPAHIKILEQIGSGNFCTVHKAFDYKAKKFIAVKLYDNTNARAFRYEQVMITLLRDGTSSIVLPDFVLPSPHMSVMTMPLGVDMSRVVDEFKYLDEQCVQLIARDLLQCLYELHKTGLVHNDIKPTNTLLFETGHFSLSDFNNCVPDREAVWETSGRSVSPPECVEGSIYSRAKVDIWYLGMTLGRLVADGDECLRLKCAPFLSLVASGDPEKRPSLSDLLDHRWLKMDARSIQTTRCTLRGIWSLLT